MQIHWTPRRLKPFRWHWFIIKVIGAPIAAFAVTIVIVGTGANADMLHAHMEHGAFVEQDVPWQNRQEIDVVHVWCTGIRVQQVTPELDAIAAQDYANNKTLCDAFPAPVGAIR